MKQAVELIEELCIDVTGVTEARFHIVIDVFLERSSMLS